MSHDSENKHLAGGTKQCAGSSIGVTALSASDAALRQLFLLTHKSCP